jgi:two-component system, cell cycle response regulator DivK
LPCESILIVEDNAINVKLARLLLVKEGFEVRSAGDSGEAFRALHSFRPSLILMDIQLPGMDGLELTRRLKREPETRDAIIIALTAYAMKGDEEKARAAGCDGYITKPINTRTFVEQIRQYLEKTAPTRSPGIQSGDPNDLLRELRNGFIAEGEESSRRIADADPSAFNLDALRRVVHHWIGIGGTLGFPQGQISI